MLIIFIESKGDRVEGVWGSRVEETSELDVPYS